MTEAHGLRVLTDATRFDILNVILVGSAYRATDHRDHIYIFLSHPSAKNLRWTNGKTISADYEKSREDLYWEVACSLIRSSSDLALLSVVEHSSNEALEQAPISWIPQWHMRDALPIMASLPGFLKWYHAGTAPDLGRMEPKSTPIYQDGKLIAGQLRSRGVVFDTVNVVSDILLWHQLFATRAPPEADPPAENLTGINGSSNPVQKAWSTRNANIALLNLPQKTKASSIISLSLILVAGLIFPFTAGEKKFIAAEDSIKSHLADFISFCKQHCDSSFAALMSSELKTSREFPDINLEGGNSITYNRCLGFHCHNRRFFITNKQEYYGLGPAIVRGGDVCCVLVGGSVPYILRPVDDSSVTTGSDSLRRYKLVGECYIDGVMRGEILNNVFSSSTGLQDVVLV